MPVLPSYRNQSIDFWLTGFNMRATLAFNGLIPTLKSCKGQLCLRDTRENEKYHMF